MSHNIEKPARLKLHYADSYKDLMTAKGEASDMGTFTLLGTAFIQGGRLRFVTAMPIYQYLDIVRDPEATVAKRNSTIIGIENKANRPTDDAHRKRISKYVRELFGYGKKAELGGFTLNYGLETSVEAENDCEMTVLGKPDGFSCAPALLVMRNPEATLRMHATDGAHRTRALITIVKDKNTSVEEKENIIKNGVPVTIVFESDMAQAHQDFADAAMAQPIKNSIRIGYDIRKPLYEATVDIIKASRLLHNRVSMTAASVNVGSGSKSGILFNSPAISMFVSELAKDGDIEKVDRNLVAGYWDSLPIYFPVFRPLDDSGSIHVKENGKLEADRLNAEGTYTLHRSSLGGSLLLKAAFCPLFARAIKEAVIRGIKVEAVLAGMSKLTWTVFRAEADAAAYEVLQRKGEGAGEDARQYFNPLLSPAIAMLETRFKLSTTSEVLDKLWDNVCLAIWGEKSRLNAPVTAVAA